MLTWFKNSWEILRGRDNHHNGAAVKQPPVQSAQAKTIDLDLASDDPLMAYLKNTTGVIEVDHLELDSPALRKLKEAGVKVTVPLISQGELIGLLNLGPRMSEQEYSSDDRRLLTTLATQAAPALRVAQMAQQRQAEARERERMENELRVARVIQQTLLPKEAPSLPGWEVLPLWQPARAVSGDFYDFIPYPDGKIGIVVADVTDKGVPAALVMATTRSIIRSCAERSEAPGEVLAQANNLLCPDIPPKMFVTCLYAVLDPTNGRMRYANAGQNLPYMRKPHGLEELCARGMPLGLFPDMDYEELEITFDPGDMLLLSSDGLVEAHNANREMYGFPRLHALMEQQTECKTLIQHLLDDLAKFTGPDLEQEDDITFLVIARLPVPVAAPEYASWQTLADFSLPSQPGNERMAVNQVIAAVQGNEQVKDLRGRLETAVSEAVMNAMEHGNHYRVEVPVRVQVLCQAERLVVRVTDQGGEVDLSRIPVPNLDAKLSGMQSPRGWGLFLIKNMVDEMEVKVNGQEHILELFFDLKEGKNGH